MYVIEKEIFSQPETLSESLAYLTDRNAELAAFFKQHSFRKIVFCGCGSSYDLCCSAAALFNLRTDAKAVALTGGEILLAPQDCRDLLADALVVTVSRSGATSEIVYALEEMKQCCNFSVLSIVAKVDTKLGRMSDLCLELPWAFDESVCQTRTVTNLYLSLLVLYRVFSGQPLPWDELSAVVDGYDAFLKEAAEICKTVAAESWSTTTILADAEVCGVAQEGALAFREICMQAGDSFRMLDYRHGPIVIANDQKLVIALVRSERADYQKFLIEDVTRRGVTLITLGSEFVREAGGHHLTIPRYDHALHGLALLGVCQLAAYYKALENGHNPDRPDGLDSWISFEKR